MPVWQLEQGSSRGLHFLRFVVSLCLAQYLGAPCVCFFPFMEAGAMEMATEAGGGDALGDGDDSITRGEGAGWADGDGDGAAPTAAEPQHMQR